LPAWLKKLPLQERQMTPEKTEVVVVGAGQAGVAMSEHLTKAGIPHMVLERDRIAERWRTERWDSLVANGPAWHDRFPSMEFSGYDPDAFVGKDDVADYFVAYAEKFNSPIRTGVDVKSVTKNVSEPGFRVETTTGTIAAKYVVAATGPFQKPAIPPVVPNGTNIHQLHSSDYHNPEQLPAGNVLVVGAGSSGVQIADDIQSSGRQVYLSVGEHDRPPRRYRGRDNVWWLGVLGKWDATTPPAGAEHVTIAVSGKDGGKTVDFRNLAANGIKLLGLTQSFNNGVMGFAPDLEKNITRGDTNYLSVLQEADAFIARNGLDLPEEPQAHVLGPMPELVRNPILELDLAANGITTILWATGYAVDYSWLQVAAALNEAGKPQHQRGVSSEPGIYFLGQPWLSRRGSAFIWGVWHDAKYIAEQIQIQRSYLTYQGTARVVN
jgi:putative flavoprotein involved in K+ transport